MADSRSKKETTMEQDKHNQQERISVRAYELWMERGCPIGSPELDWFQAEAEMTGTQSTQKQTQRVAA